MRIGISQINTRAGDLAHTAERMADISQVAAGRGVDLLVFGLTTLTGQLAVDFSEEEAFLLDLVRTLTSLAGKVACDCLVPLAIPVGETMDREAVYLHGGIVSPLRLNALRHEQADMAAMPELLLKDPLTSFEHAGNRIGLAFSYEDLDEWCDRRGELDLLCYVSSYSYAVDDVSSALGEALDEGRFVQDAQEIGAWLVGAGSVGCYDTQVFSGSSFVLAPDGRLVALAAPFEEDLLVADLGVGVTLPAGSEAPAEFYDERYHLWQALVLGIRDHVQKLGLTDVCLALDGSLSSMLLAVLATDALGPTHVHALLCASAASERVADIARLGRSLRIDVRPLPDLPQDDEALARDLVQLQLAALARETGTLPLSCVDKTGLALEAPADGVSAARFAPLGDLYRIDAFDVARFRNTVSPVFSSLEVRPCDLPSLGLEVNAWECEQLLERIDGILASHVEGEQGLSEVAISSGDEQLTEAVLRAFRQREPFRQTTPPCLILSTRTLRDAYMPLGFAWSDRLRQDPPDELRRELEALLEKPKDAPAPSGRLHRASPEELAEHQGELMEALELLRELAMGGNPDWTEPFSEN